MLDLWFYISDYEQYYLLECDTFWSGRGFFTFWKNILSPSSGSKSKPCKPSASKAMLLACSLLSLLFDPEDEESTFLQNVSKLLLDHTASDPRRQHSSLFYYFLQFRSVGVVTRLWAGQPRLNFQYGQEIFLFSIASRLALPSPTLLLNGYQR
jgi:hypothetical protein